MPRLPPRLLRQAYPINPTLLPLLPICRDIRSAHLELKWLSEHAAKISRGRPLINVDRLIKSYVTRRSRGEPLQLILGSEYFGDLELKCHPDVLIPRQETAVSITHLVHLLLLNVHTIAPKLRVLDLCTGSGCIPLLFNHKFYSRLSDTNKPQDVELDVVGVDLSSSAIKLSRENQRTQLSHLKRTRSTQSLQNKTLEGMSFLQADILRHDQATSSEIPSLLESLQNHRNGKVELKCDILISNPPYISPTDYYRTTSPSVRNYEPKSALVPPTLTAGLKNSDGDLFYHHILQHAQQLDAQILLVEVADLEQAKRVAALMIKQGIWDGVKIWRDDPNARCETQSALVPLQHHGESRSVPVLGSGNGRSVLAFRHRGTQWLSKLRSQELGQGLS